jgi:MFS family permease
VADDGGVDPAHPRLDSAQGRWVLVASVLGSALAALILLGGVLGDRFGRRRVFVVGVVWFALASLLCGVAPSIEVLVAARVLQGVGGALLTPGSLALLQSTFEGEDRARAIGAWSGLGGVAAAAGPFLGGWLVDVASWRWVFLLNLPLAALVVWIAVRHVPESRDPQAEGRIDATGSALGVAVLAATTYALIGVGSRAPRPRSSSPGARGWWRWSPSSSSSAASPTRCCRSPRSGTRSSAPPTP